jgi:hypothetical protein
MALPGSWLILDVKMPADTEHLLLELSHVPLRIPFAIKRGMDRALQLIVGKIQRNRLSGTGPYPVSQHRLGTRTGQLQRSARAEPALITGGGETVTGAIGTPIIYGEVHEFGKTIVARSAKAMIFRIGPKLIFARKVVIPERAAFRTEILANYDLIQDEVASALEDEVAKL